MENLTHANKEKKSFADFLIILMKWRKIIFLNVFTITILATGISLIIDKWYTSTANIIPPKSSGGLLGDITSFSTTIKDLSKTLGRLGTVSEEAYNYLAILQSRTCFEKVIDKFNLRKVYKFKDSDPIEDIIKELGNNVEFNVEDEGNITIKVTDKNPKRAADMANYFVEVLNEISIELGTYEAKNNREFIEKRYLQVLKDLKTAEDSLKDFSQEYSVYSITDQTKAAITAAAELKARITVEEIELDLMKKNYGDTNPIIANKKIVIDELQKRLKAMEFSDENSKKGNFFTPFSQLPDVGVKYLRLMREYELQAKLLEFILPIYEQAKIEEKKNIPVCLVLDKAVPAQKKTGPKRAIIVGASFLISLFLSILVVLILDFFERLKQDEEQYRKINEGLFLPLKKMLHLKRK
ncbi:GumC family protein [Melioribacteraceae bacterium 4301-Me]|uniref:GumC family protein n=1 Tax=Pyranulibacter aquaticus TaxID=3163344 RepID=UPI003597F631